MELYLKLILVDRVTPQYVRETSKLHGGSGDGKQNKKRFMSSTKKMVDQWRSLLINVGCPRWSHFI